MGDGLTLAGTKVLLAIVNFLLLASGFALVSGGMLVLFDNERILVSKLLASSGPFADLPQPYFYYVAIGLALLGLTLAAAGILGCWASCLHNFWLLSFYFVLVMAVLLGECTVYGVAWLWPHCVGLGLDGDALVKTLQRNYGVSGQDQFTAAVDLAQVTFNCCGIFSANEYDTSLWRLQGLGQPLAIPLSCCDLQNGEEGRAYLSPMPINSSLCQALERHTHEGYRHVAGCHERLDQWYRDHYVVFLGIGLAVVLVEFLVLLSTVLTCTRIYHHNQEESRDNVRNTAQDESVDYAFRQKGVSGHGGYCNETYAMTDSFRPNYKVLDKV
ncbi:tetraspanin-11 [Anthonomus grandis grandis]|uniref:tetraspanin-11 n=1 Tax=Anthonomus grandis grandis TaxID=2921223 RepID=UPI002166A197|nr:tetraspanin-11 [Anthonomus grandis grandis]